MAVVAFNIFQSLFVYNVHYSVEHNSVLFYLVIYVRMWSDIPHWKKKTLQMCLLKI